MVLIQQVKTQYTITIPTVLIKVLEWNKGDNIKLTLDSNKTILLTKEVKHE
jgi:antitoxin component of MazEF toxin-antitoxin module